MSSKNIRERNPRQSETPREQHPRHQDNRPRPINFPNQIRVRLHVPVQRPCVPALIPTDPFLGPWPSQYPPNYYQNYRVRPTHGPRPRGSVHQRSNRPTATVTSASFGASTSYQSWRNTLWPGAQHLRGAQPSHLPLLVDELDMPYARGPRGEIAYNNRQLSSNINPRLRSSRHSIPRPQRGRPSPISPCRPQTERNQRAQKYWARVNSLNPAPGTSTGIQHSSTSTQTRRKKNLKKVNRNPAKPMEDSSSSSSETLTPKKQHISKPKKKIPHKTDNSLSSSTDYPSWEDLSHTSSYSDSDF